MLALFVGPGRHELLRFGRTVPWAQSLEEIMEHDEQIPAVAGWQPTDDYIAALHRERDGYVQAGLDDRAAEVAEQLKTLGHPLKRRRATT